VIFQPSVHSLDRQEDGLNCAIKIINYIPQLVFPRGVSAPCFSTLCLDHTSLD
jgi:hypothetical protein